MYIMLCGFTHGSGLIYSNLAGSLTLAFTSDIRIVCEFIVRMSVTRISRLSGLNFDRK